MRLVLLQILVLLLSCYSCYSETCDGTCVAMDSIATQLDAACTKSADCLILSCQTPRKAARYGAKAKPRIQIYPCEHPPVLNLQVDGSFLGSTFKEDRNFTSDTDYSKTIYILGLPQTILMHIRMSSYARKIIFKLSVTYGSNTYTVIPTTTIPIDKRGCEGMSSTTQNPLCIVATTQTTVTTIQTTTETTIGTTGTTTVSTGTTTGPIGTTTGPTETTIGTTGTTTGPIGTTTGPTETTIGTTGTTTGTTGTTTVSTGTTTVSTGTTTGTTATTTVSTGTTTEPTATTTGHIGTTTGHTGTTVGHPGTTTGHTITTTGPNGPTMEHTGTTTGHTGPTMEHTGTTTGSTMEHTGHTGTITEPTGPTMGHTGTTTGPVIINHNSLSNTETPPQVTGGAIGGIVAAICILLLISVTIATSFVLLIAYRRKVDRYSRLENPSIEM